MHVWDGASPSARARFSALAPPAALTLHLALPPLHTPGRPQPKNLMVSAGARAKEYDKSKYISILNIIQVG